MNDPSEARASYRDEADEPDMAIEQAAEIDETYANVRDVQPAAQLDDTYANARDAQPADLGDAYGNARDGANGAPRGAQAPRAPRAEEQRPAKEPRFAKLYEAERETIRKMPDGKTIAKNRATFLRNPPPGRGASFEQLNAYREKAFDAGISITAADLEAYQTTLEEYGPEVIIASASMGTTPQGGQSVLAQAVIAHNPHAVEQMRFNVTRVVDMRENYAPPLTQDIDPQSVTADHAAFAGKMERLAAQKPPSKAPGYAEFSELRNAMRGVGVRLTVEDLQAYTKAVADSSRHALRAPGAASDLPLSAQILVDLGRKPADRQLVGASPERWDHVLARNPQVPAFDRAQSPAPERITPQAPPVTPQIPSVAPRARDAENPYGVRIPAEAPQRPQMTRNGETVEIHDGYRQTGKIVAIDAANDRIFQQISKHDTVSYALRDVERAMPRGQLEQAAAAKDDVQIRVNDGAMSAKNVSHERERTRERTAPSIA